MTTKTKKIISLTFIGIFCSVFLIVSGLHLNIIKLPYAGSMSAQYDANYGDDRILVGGSNNVFVGKVIEQVGSTPSKAGTPYTQFSVEIIDNIKGKLEGKVVVNQTGGYKNGVLYVMSGETGDSLHSGDNIKYLLQPGSTYLFATRGNSMDKYGGFYWLNSYPTAYKVISTDKTLSSEQLLELSKNDARVKALLSAYPNEILLEADIARLGTPNSFKSLSVEEQEKIKTEVEKMKITAVPVATE